MQDAVEFLMSFVIPFGSKVVKLKSHKELLEDVEVPNWLSPSLYLSYYLHFFRGDLESLPEDMINIKR